MANNANVNKVVYGDTTLMDLTQDSVEASNLLEGETAHDRSGSPVTGTAKQGHILKNQAGTAMTQRAKLQFLDANLLDDSTNGKTKVEVVKQLTKAQIEALGNNTDGFYESTDENDDIISAEDIAYDNTTSQLTADDVQEAIDEVKSIADGAYTYTNLIDSSDDLNDIITPGHYTFAAGSRPANKPTDAPITNGHLIVEYQSGGGTTYFQTYVCVYYSIVHIWIRRNWTGTWGNWNRIALTSDFPSNEYAEFTTASGETVPSCVDFVNAGFLSSGRVSILKMNNQITVRVAGITTKSSQDWICCLKSGYRPVLSADEYFTYCLGDDVYKGFVTPSGYIFFQALDTTHILSATITFNIA